MSVNTLKSYISSSDLVIVGVSSFPYFIVEHVIEDIQQLKCQKVHPIKTDNILAISVSNLKIKAPMTSAYSEMRCFTEGS